MRIDQLHPTDEVSSQLTHDHLEHHTCGDCGSHHRGGSGLSKRFPRYGALLLSLPTISLLAFLFSWFQYRDLPAISKLAKETLILVLMGLPFFVPFVFSNQLGLGFWASMGLGIVMASLTVGAWLMLGPSS